MLTALTITAVLWAPGIAWGTWLCPLPLKRTTTHAWMIAGAVLATGLPAVLLISWVLLELGCFGPASLTGGLLALTAVGAGIGWRCHRDALQNAAHQSILPFVLFLFASVLLTTQAPRGEWIAGGWDPGVYMNQGIYAAQQGGWRTSPMPIHAALAERDFNPFVRPIAGRDELFPGIPLDQDDGTIRLTFYPLTPVWIALLYQAGGLTLALHAFPLLWLIFGFLFSAGLLRIGAAPVTTVAATLLVLLHPLMLHHAHTPCSEMLEALFVAMLLLTLPIKEKRAWWLFLPLILLAGMLNRPTFLFWVMLLLPWLAITRQLTPLRAIAIGASLAASVCYYYTLGAASLDRAGHLFDRMVTAALFVLLGSLLLAAWRARWNWRHRDAALFVLMPVLILATLHLTQPGGTFELRHNAMKLIPYAGRPLILAAGIGFLIRLRTILVTGRATPFDIAIAMCIGAGLIPLGYKYMAELYPWATKRFLSSMPLALGLCTAATLTALHNLVRKRWPQAGSVTVVMGLLILIGSEGAGMREAWQHTEYDELSAVLDEIAERVHDDDVLLADHFVWATPLALIHNRPVLNGERLWAKESSFRTAHALSFLNAQNQIPGRRILILTGTDAGIDVFPAAFHDVELLETFEPYTYSVIAHHRNGQRFPKREQTAQFRLYRLRIQDAILSPGDNLTGEQ